MDSIPLEDIELLNSRYPNTVELFYLVLRGGHKLGPEAVRRLFEAIQKVAHQEIERIERLEKEA